MKKMMFIALASVLFLSSVRGQEKLNLPKLNEITDAGSLSGFQNYAFNLVSAYQDLGLKMMFRTKENQIILWAQKSIESSDKRYIGKFIFGKHNYGMKETENGVEVVKYYSDYYFANAEKGDVYCSMDKLYLPPSDPEAKAKFKATPFWQIEPVKDRSPYCYIYHVETNNYLTLGRGEDGVYTVKMQPKKSNVDGTQQWKLRLIKK